MYKCDNMNDHRKTKKQLIDELQSLRKQLENSNTTGAGTVEHNKPSPAAAKRIEPIVMNYSEQQQFLESIYLGTDEAIFVVDVTEDEDFIFSGLNPAHEKISGLSSKWIKGRRPEQLSPKIPESATKEIRRNYERCLQKGRTIEYEEMIPIKGKNIWWLTRLTPIKDKIGRIYRILGSATDITKLKRIQKELEETRASLEEKVRARTFELNERLKEINCLYQIDRILFHTKRPIPQLMHDILQEIPPGWKEPEHTGACITFLGKTYRTARFKQSRWILQRDIDWRGDSLGQIEVAYLRDVPENPFLAEEEPLLETIANRIAERYGQIQTQTALKQNERRLTLVIKATGVAVWDWNLNEDKIRWNETICTVFKHKRQIWNKGKSKRYENIHPEDRERIRRYIKEKSDEGADTWKIEYRFKKGDGTFADVIEWGQIIRDENNHIEQMIGAVLDITDRKNFERELELKNDELEQVLYATSHDLRSPLINVQGFNKELEAAMSELEAILIKADIPAEVWDQCQPIIEKDVPEALMFILSSTAKMDQLLKGLLNLSRIGRQTLNLVDLDMDNLIKEIINTLTMTIRERNIEVRISELPPCSGDAMMINQVFTNLIENAVKYLRPDHPGIIQISGKSYNGYCKYTVRDNGLGIHANHINKIFDLFHQLNPSKAEKGLGVGLAIVRRVLDRHNGAIDVESAPGEGSAFIVTLPTSVSG